MKRLSNVFYISVAIIAVIVLYGAIAPESLGAVTDIIQQKITDVFGWYYLLLVAGLVLACIFFIVSPVGQITLGQPDEKPEYSFVSWIAMLFSAGMGIGLIFFGAAEPLSHYAIDPATATPETQEAFKESMRMTFLHYGIHIWAIYSAVALPLAYFQFRKKEPGLISTTLKPLFGDRMDGGAGTFVDVLTVIATVFGVATSLGFGAMQINGGLSYLFDIPVTFWVQLIIIMIVTVLFMMSAWSGLSKGIKYLSNSNLVLAFILLLLVLFVGPTLFLMNTFVDTIGSYIQNFPEMSFRTAPGDSGARAWINDWTIFYWAWWISWAPFVGMFIARVSRGRTIREFLLAVLLTPTILSFLWFSVFGGTAIDIQQSGTDLTGFLTEELLFAVFDSMPMSAVLSIVALLLVTTFFVTSADSATYVLGVQTSHGSLNPAVGVKLTWGIAQSSIAAILLSANGLDALQNALIIAALPFSIILILMVISFSKALFEEREEMGLKVRPYSEQEKKEIEEQEEKERLLEEKIAKARLEAEKEDEEREALKEAQSIE